jgi:Lon protease-like protein
VIEIPLFPLRSVLCPGVALPMHIFEERYRLMINRCIDRGEPFGVVLLREGRETGALQGGVAAVGTTALIRRAGTYPDGRLEILTVGGPRFRLEDVDNVSEPYLVGRVSLLEEPTGPEALVAERAERVGRHFLEYLELLQPEGVADGPEIEIEFEIDVEDEDDADEAVPTGDGVADLTDVTEAVAQELDTADLSPEQRRELLMTAAQRLTGTDDPTALSYVLTALIQVDLASRQELLEAAHTAARLERLERLLARERWFLKQGLRPIIIDPQQPGSHRG